MSRDGQGRDGMGLDWRGEGHVGPGRAKVGRGNDAVRMARWEVGEAKKREGKKGGRGKEIISPRDMLLCGRKSGGDVLRTRLNRNIRVPTRKCLRLRDQR